jgi:hypothetical protein
MGWVCKTLTKSKEIMFWASSEGKLFQECTGDKREINVEKEIIEIFMEDLLYLADDDNDTEI